MAEVFLLTTATGRLYRYRSTSCAQTTLLLMLVASDTQQAVSYTQIDVDIAASRQVLVHTDIVSRGKATS